MGGPTSKHVFIWKMGANLTSTARGANFAGGMAFGKCHFCLPSARPPPRVPIVWANRGLKRSLIWKLVGWLAPNEPANNEKAVRQAVDYRDGRSPPSEDQLKKEKQLE